MQSCGAVIDKGPAGSRPSEPQIDARLHGDHGEQAGVAVLPLTSSSSSMLSPIMVRTGPRASSVCDGLTTPHRPALQHGGGRDLQLPRKECPRDQPPVRAVPTSPGLGSADLAAVVDHLQILQVRSDSNNYGPRRAGPANAAREATKEPAHQAKGSPVCRIRSVQDDRSGTWPGRH